MDTISNIEDNATSLIRLRGASQITLPRELREAAHLSEGDYLEARWTEEGILLRPVSISPRTITPAQEAEIQAVVDGVRRDYAAERRS